MAISLVAVKIQSPHDVILHQQVSLYFKYSEKKTQLLKNICNHKASPQAFSNTLCSNGGSLMTIRTTMEMGIAASFTGGNKELWVGSSSTTANSFTWTNGNAAFISATSLWCPSN